MADEEIRVAPGDLARLDDVAKGLQSVGAKLNAAAIGSALSRLDGMINTLQRNLDDVAKFLGVSDVGSLRQRVDALEGAVGGGRNLGRNVRTLGPKAGLLLTAAEVVAGGAIGSLKADYARDAAVARQRVADFAFTRLREGEIRHRKILAEEAAQRRASVGLRGRR